MLDAGSINTKDIYNKFTKADCSSNKQYLVNSYAATPKRDEVVIYNDPKKAKKTKIKVIAALTATAAAIAGITVAIVNSRHGGSSISKILNPENLQQTTKGIYEKAANFLSNINPLKDDAIERAGDFLEHKNIPILRHFNKYCSGTKEFYKSILYKSQQQHYEKAAETLRKQGVEVPTFQKWFEDLNGVIRQSLKGANNEAHFTKGVFNKGIFKRMTQSNIADDFLAKNEGFRNLFENLQGVEKLDEEGRAALEAFNKTRGTITAKLRDINAGSAATDFMTMAFSTGGLGIAMAASDTKEERKSIGINLGIPLLTALGCTFIGNIKAIAGAKSLLFGLAMGRVASIAAKAIDKKITKNDTKA